MRQYAAAIDGVKAQATEIGASRARPGSFDALAVAYYRSEAFRGMGPSTQTDRRNIIERFRAEHGSKPLKLLKRAHISEIIGAKANTPEAANKLLKVLRAMLSFAIEIEMIEDNPTTGVKKYRRQGDGFHSWTEAEVEQFRQAHPVGSKARLALTLLHRTVQRRGDVVTMGWQHVSKDRKGTNWIRVRQQKTGTSLQLPLHPELVEALEALPRTNLTFLMTEYGAPITAAGFGNWFREQCKLAGLPGHCSAHGLRKAACTLLAEAGCTEYQIAAFSGHRLNGQVAHYTRAAEQPRLALQALELLLRMESEQNLSNLPPRLDKTDAK
jgi:integrase